MRAPGYESPWRLAVLWLTKVLFTCTLEKTKAPRGATPHSWRTRGAEAERGLGPEPGPATRALPKRGGASTGEEKEKGDYGELQLAVCKRKYEGAELRHGRPKPAAANANSSSLRALVYDVDRLEACLRRNESLS